MSVQNAGDVEHLDGAAAVKKMQEMVDAANIGFFTTLLTQLPLDTRPMATQKVDDDGNFWFLSSASSHKNNHIEQDPRVQLFYSNRNGFEYLSVYGTATVSRDRKKIEEMWTNMAKAWFKEGKDDPDLTLIKVKPEDAYYWDTNSNKMVSLVKIMVSAVSGASMDNGVEGKLSV